MQDKKYKTRKIKNNKHLSVARLPLQILITLAGPGKLTLESALSLLMA